MKRYYGGDLSVLDGIKQKHLRGGLKRVEMCYLKECVEGDLVLTHLWQEAGRDTEVMCSVELASGEPLCHLTLEYFAPLSAL